MKKASSITVAICSATLRAKRREENMEKSVLLSESVKRKHPRYVRQDTDKYQNLDENTVIHITLKTF